MRSHRLCADCQAAEWLVSPLCGDCWDYYLTLESAGLLQGEAIDEHSLRIVGKHRDYTLSNY